MKIWYYNELIDVTFGQKFLVARSGSGHFYFGEYATLTRKTSRHLVFITDSGAQVKTSNYSLWTIGKAAKEGYFVSPKIEGRDDDPNFIKSNVMFWDDKKCKLVNK